MTFVTFTLVNFTCKNQYLYPWTYVEFLGMTRFIAVLIGNVGGLYGIPLVKKKVPGMYLIYPAQNEVRWIPLVGTAQEPHAPKMSKNFDQLGHC